MQSIIFFIVGLLQLSIAIYGTKQLRSHFNWYALLVLIVVYSLAYDNIVLASGAMLGEGATLKALNAPRYWIHALFTPTMIIAAFGALRMTDSNFGKGRIAHIVICVIATVLVALGSYTDIIKLDLVYEAENSIYKYVNQFVLMPGPPIQSVMTIIFALVFGIMMWRNIKWPWLFIGSLLMFIAAPMASVPIFQNIGEIAFAAGLITTQIRATRG